MTENKRFTIQSDSHAEEIKLLIDKEQMVMWSFLHHDEAVNSICDLLNELNDEKEQLKKILNELSDMLQFDVENGIRSYPVKLSEYLSNALKELGND